MAWCCARIAAAGLTHLGHLSFEPMPTKATCTKKMQLVPVILPAGRRKLNQSLAMIRDKGFSTLSLSLVDPQKIDNSTKTGKSRQCPSRSLVLQRSQNSPQVLQAPRMNPTSP